MVGGKKCSVSGCVNSKVGAEGPGVTLHAYPKDPNIKKNWTLLCGTGSWICSAHFTPEDYEEGGAKLHSLAVPSMNLLIAKSSEITLQDIEEQLRSEDESPEPKVERKRGRPKGPRKPSAETPVKKPRTKSPVPESPRVGGRRGLERKVKRPKKYLDSDEEAEVERNQVLMKKTVKQEIESEESERGEEEGDEDEDFTLEDKQRSESEESEKETPAKDKDRTKSEPSQVIFYLPPSNEPSTLKSRLEQKEKLVEMLSDKLAKTRHELHLTKINMGRQISILKNLTKINSIVDARVRKILSKIFTPAQIKVVMYGKRRPNWTVEEIEIGNTLRKISKAAFIYVTKTLNFPLPGMSTLQRWDSKSYKEGEEEGGSSEGGEETGGEETEEQNDAIEREILSLEEELKSSKGWRKSKPPPSSEPSKKQDKEEDLALSDLEDLEDEGIIEEDPDMSVDEEDDELNLVMKELNQLEGELGAADEEGDGGGSEDLDEGELESMERELKEMEAEAKAS